MRGMAVAGTLALLAIGGTSARAQPCPGELVEELFPTPPGISRVFLRSIEAIAPNDIWAVGDMRDASFDQFSLTLHFDGTSWTRVPSPQPNNTVGDTNIMVHDVDAVRSDLVYAVGAYERMINVFDTLVLRWDGTQWQKILSPGRSAFGANGFLFEAVSAISENDVWFGGQSAACVRGSGYMVHYDGSRFTEYCIAGSSLGATRVRAIDALAPDDVWAVGGSGGTASAIGKSYVIHWDGSSWTHMSPPQLGFGEVLRAVEAISPNDVWAVGKYDNVGVATPLFWHWDGSSWTQHAGPAFARDLFAFASDDLYAIGGGDLMHWNGSGWSIIDQIDPTFRSVNMAGIDAVGPCQLVLAGSTSSPNRGLLATFGDSSNCYADCDQSTGAGVLDIFDFLCFQNSFVAAEPYACDCDTSTGPAVCDIFDFLCFQNAFVAGCP
jgi:hypothetical protein